MKVSQFACLLISFIVFSVAPPVDKSAKSDRDGMYHLDTSNMTDKEAQEQEYYRYLHQIVGELHNDPAFAKAVDNVTEEDIKSGKVADLIDLVGHGVRRKVDEMKRMEVEYQRDLLRKKKHHMVGSEQNYWNPIHQENQETFDKEDLEKLLRKHNDIIAEQDKIRHEEFKKHELEKEHKRRESMKNMTADEKTVAEKKHKESHHKPHEKIHEPGHKAQLEEVWEQEDGFDAESFDPKTFFNYHDTNSDGYWDYFEQESLFIHDLNKIYNLSDPEMGDQWEREEELEQMRTYMLKTYDHDRDGLISKEEFMSETNNPGFEKDTEWKPLVEEDQFSEDDFAEYEKMLEKSWAGSHGPPGHDDAVHQATHLKTNSTEAKKA